MTEASIGTLKFLRGMRKKRKKKKNNFEEYQKLHPGTSVSPNMFRTYGNQAYPGRRWKACGGREEAEEEKERDIRQDVPSYHHAQQSLFPKVDEEGKAGCKLQRLYVQLPGTPPL